MTDYATLPKGLNADSWWKEANCKGLPATKVIPETCISCNVHRECIWFAITEDDRIDDHGMFIRGGLTGAVRDTIWHKNRTKPLAAYIEALTKAALIKEKIVREQKDGKHK